MLRGRRGKDALIALAVAAIAALVMAPNWTAPTFWETDGLFYEAQKEEVEGKPREEALRGVFASGLGAELRREERDLPYAERDVENREWVQFSARFYRRRWTVPVAAAAIDPLFGVDSLEKVALAGFVAAAVLLFLLLRRRFGTLVSFGVTVACLLLPPLRHAGTEPSTDSWGLALVIAGLLCASLAVERGRRWLVPWLLVVLALSFTRDLTVVLVIAAAWLAFRLRTRTAVALAAGGVLAALPAPLIAGTPFRENLAYVIEDFRVPTHTSWGFVLSHYPGQLLSVIGDDLSYPFDFSFPPPMVGALLLVLAGFAAVAFLAPRGDPFFMLMQAALAGGVVTILLSINFSNWRLELAMLPPAAVGVALLAERALSALSRHRREAATRRVPPPPRPATPAA